MNLEKKNHLIVGISDSLHTADIIYIYMSISSGTSIGTRKGHSAVLQQQVSSTRNRNHTPF